MAFSMRGEAGREKDPERNACLTRRRPGRSPSIVNGMLAIGSALLGLALGGAGGAEPDARAGKVLALGRTEEALATLDALLAANPDHDAAKALKAELLAQGPVKIEVPVVPAGVPPPSSPGHLPRKVEPRKLDAARILRSDTAPGR